MAEISPPAWVEQGSNHARAARLLSSALATPGIWAPGDLLVTNPSTVNLSVALGGAYVAATNAGNGFFACYNDATKTGLTVPSAPTSTQVSLVVARVRAQEFGDGSDSFILEVVSGTPGGGQPATPNNSLLLATATVNTASTTINTLSDKRVLSGHYAGTIPCTSVTRPSGGNLRVGSQIHETDTGKRYSWDGAAWQITSNSLAWTIYTPSAFTNCTSPTGSFAYRQLDAKTLLLRYNFTGGTVTATATCSFTLPAGFTTASTVRFASVSATSGLPAWVATSGLSTCVTRDTVSAGTTLPNSLGSGVAIIEVA